MVGAGGFGGGLLMGLSPKLAGCVVPVLFAVGSLKWTFSTVAGFGGAGLGGGGLEGTALD